MQKLEKILEEMKESSIMVATSKEHYIHPQDGRFVEEVVLLNDVEEIIRKHMSGKGKDAHMNDGWIPVGERLPEDDVDVLVTYADIDDEEYADITITTYGNAYLGGNKLDFKEWRSPFEYFKSNYKVMAWQYLPEPYRPERSRENEK